MLSKIDYEIKDIFISHSSKDKEKYIDLLVNKLEAAGLSCWYDSFEIIPGDSLVEKINHGLTHSKIVLFCISDDFFKGKWAIAEFKSVVAINIINKDTLRFIPLLIGEIESIVKQFPIPLADTVYIKWNENLNSVIDAILKVKYKVDGLGKKYWNSRAKDAYDLGNFIDAALFARRVLEYDRKSYYALIVLIASMLKLKDNMSAYKLIFNYQDEWDYFNHHDAPKEILDYAQEIISLHVVGDEIDKTGFSFAIVSFLSSPSNKDSWKHLARLFSREHFSFHRGSIARYVVFYGGNDGISWAKTILKVKQEEEVKESIVTMLTLLIEKESELTVEILNILRPMLKDDCEGVRSIALIPFYFFDANGSHIVVSALNDKSPEVRYQALELLIGRYVLQSYDELTGGISKESFENFDDFFDDNDNPSESYNIEPSDDVGKYNIKLFKERSERPPDSLLSEDIIKKLLIDDDEAVFELVADALIEERLMCPQGIDIMDIKRPLTFEYRQLQIKQIGKNVTDSSYQKILNYALNDQHELVRRVAVSLLKDKDFVLKDNDLKTLYDNENINDVKDDIQDLILEKGGAQLGFIYLEILMRDIDNSFRGKQALDRIFSLNDPEMIDKAIKVCNDAGKIDLLSDHFSLMFVHNFNKSLLNLVNYCLDNEQELENAILGAGLINEIPLERITAFNSHDDINVRIFSFRAEENREKNGAGIDKLHNLYKEVFGQVKESDFSAQWAVLHIIDGIIEFGNTDNAINMLMDFYNDATKQKKGSFPIREAWERLKILGVDIQHDIYSEAPPITPKKWTTREGPFYKPVINRI